MKISDVLPIIKTDTEFFGLSNNSKKIVPGDLFFCMNGNAENCYEAIENGCVAIFSIKKIDVTIEHYVISDIKELLGYFSYMFYKKTTDKIKMIGVTGTDGKTTTVTLIYHVLNAYKGCGLIGTNGIYYKDRHVKTANTTPGCIECHKAIYDIYKSDIYYLAMEVSSEGILDKRISYLYYDCLIFTNLTIEHLNTHKTMENYYQTKKNFFKHAKSESLRIINTDDFYGNRLYGELRGNKVSYGVYSGTYQAKNIQLNYEYSSFDLYKNNSFIHSFKIPLFGQYNIYNALAAIISLLYMQIPLSFIENKLSESIVIKGRFKKIVNKFDCIIDFAHTPNALNSLLLNLRNICDKRIILVIGAQGQKDRTKRPMIGNIATKYADFVIFTSEDPKNENLENILSELTEDVSSYNYMVMKSRKQAIKKAILMADRNDIVLICGKGQESFELIKDKKYRHNDYVIAKRFIDILNP